MKKTLLILSVLATTLCNLASPFAATAAPIKVETYMKDLVTNEEFEFEENFSSSESHAFLYLTSAGSVVFQVNVNDYWFNEQTQEGNIEIFYSAISTNDNRVAIKTKISRSLSSTLAQPIFGGDFSAAIGPIAEPASSDLTAALLTNGQVLTGSEIYGNDLFTCGSNCFVGLYGNGLASIPSAPVTRSVGVAYETELEIIDQFSSTSNIHINNSAVCPDLNGDDIVDSADLGILIGAYGPANNSFDLTQDGYVNGADLAILLGAYGAC
ncbi:MAG: hypothetical protein J0M12_05520 [Deltaproteobacteria bacterium]|nr:hypothetical protein [Deltaproteobacteria bacterium]